VKISIITATYNSIKCISSALDSIKQQSYSNLELILIDGGSTDGTVNWLKQCKMASQLVSEPDQGIYDALNKGIKLATGDVIGFLHSDDLFASSRTIENIANAFSTMPSLGAGLAGGAVVYGDLVFIDPFDTDKIIRYWKSQTFQPELLRRGWMPPHPTVFMDRQAYANHGLFNTNFKCSADYDYMLRVFRDPTVTVVYLPEVITKMRMGGMSTGGLKSRLNKKKEDYLVLKNNQMPFPLWILLAKNVSKIPQLVFRKDKNR